MNRIRIAVAVPLAALAFAACGGDDGPSKQEFVADADKICKDLDAAGERIGQGGLNNVNQIKTFAQDLRSTAEDAVKKVEDLEVPGGDDGETAEDWKNAVKKEAEDQLYPVLDAMEKAAEANDEQAIVKAAQDLQGLESNESDRLAKELGMKECGN